MRKPPSDRMGYLEINWVLLKRGRKKRESFRSRRMKSRNATWSIRNPTLLGGIPVPSPEKISETFFLGEKNADDGMETVEILFKCKCGWGTLKRQSFKA
ncbi:hypothetical protein AVEN_270584-1 [Araneus ventricosus]|uniref:Uncharacterized protein n=1 Tax=Araneus ventricosus TaxID=182803 RepID=A0A4Y2B7D1_ARAVE|nr:hypothetical protein AVEN_270584-1 [Araneus ventricosus]